MRKPVVTVAFGDPYVLGELPTTDVVLAAYTGLRQSEQAVGRALIGSIEITGKLPVTISGKFKLGEGVHFRSSQRTRK
jgi:beta-N-acetylhexosaminidase